MFRRKDRPLSDEEAEHIRWADSLKDVPSTPTNPFLDILRSVTREEKTVTDNSNEVVNTSVMIPVDAPDPSPEPIDPDSPDFVPPDEFTSPPAPYDDVKDEV